MVDVSASYDWLPEGNRFNDGGLYAGSNPNVLMVVYPLVN